MCNSVSGVHGIQKSRYPEAASYIYSQRKKIFWLSASIDAEAGNVPSFSKKKYIVSENGGKQGGSHEEERPCPRALRFTGPNC